MFRLVLDGVMLVVLHLGFVLDHLAIKFVDERIDGSVQVMGNALRMQVLAAYTQGNFGFLALFFFREFINGQDDSDINDMIEMALDAFQFGLYIFADGWGQFEVMSTDCEIHTALLLVKSLAVRDGSRIAPPEHSNG
jgi:hypothetical protein